MAWLSDFVRRPFLRDWDHPRQTIILRVGQYGSEHYYVTREKLRVTPKQAGELFVFVNDAVIAVPGYYGVFYTSDETVRLRVRWYRTKRGDVDASELDTQSSPN